MGNIGFQEATSCFMTDAVFTHAGQSLRRPRVAGAAQTEPPPTRSVATRAQRTVAAGLARRENQHVILQAGWLNEAARIAASVITLGHEAHFSARPGLPLK